MKNKKAFSVLELILAAGLFSIFAIGIALAVFAASSTQQKSIQLQMARQFSSEGIEAARALRSQSFDTLTNTDGSGITFDSENSKWKLDGPKDDWQGFTRVITIKSAQRDGDNNIVTNSGTDDPDMKRVTSTVTKGNISVEFSAYFSRRDIAPVIP